MTYPDPIRSFYQADQCFWFTDSMEFLPRPRCWGVSRPAPGRWACTARRSARYRSYNVTFFSALFHAVKSLGFLFFLNPASTETFFWTKFAQIWRGCLWGPKRNSTLLFFFSCALLRIWSHNTFFHFNFFFFFKSLLRVIFWLIFAAPSLIYLGFISVGFLAKSLMVSEIWIWKC